MIRAFWATTTWRSFDADLVAHYHPVLTMPLSDVTRDAVNAAIQEHDRLGVDAFLPGSCLKARAASHSERQAIPMALELLVRRAKWSVLRWDD